MELRPQDIVVALKLLLPQKNRHWTYASLADELCMSSSQAFRSVERAEVAGLLKPTTNLTSSPNGEPGKQSAISGPVNRSNLKEFLIHGVQYAFPVQRGAITRGMPTAEAAPPLNQHLMPPPPSQLPPVWPFAEGRTRGLELPPLYKNAPKAAMRDPELYELLALVDAIRGGRAREREIAARELVSRIDALG
jgi:hypothetical protein